jgi:hypothetical protein
MKRFFKVFLLILLVEISLEREDFENYQEFDNAKFIQPYFDARRDVVFMVYTRQNPDEGSQIGLSDIVTLRTSTYNPALETRYFLDHIYALKHH